MREFLKTSKGGRLYLWLWKTSIADRSGHMARLLSCQNAYGYKRQGELTVPAATAIIANRANLDLHAAFNDGQY